MARPRTLPYSHRTVARRTGFTPSDPNAVHRRFEQIRARAFIKPAQQEREETKAFELAKQALSHPPPDPAPPDSQQAASTVVPITPATPQAPSKRRRPTLKPKGRGAMKPKRQSSSPR